MWSNISVFSAVRHSDKPVEWLKRRLEMAKGVPLDITLSVACSTRFDTGYSERWGGKSSDKVVKQLHKLVFSSGTERWRSLTVLDGNRTANDFPVPHAFLHGHPAITSLAYGDANAAFRSWISSKAREAVFPRLTTLDIQYNYMPTNDVYVGLYNAIYWTATGLKQCFLHENQIPLGFLNKPERLFRGLSVLKAGSSMLDVPVVSKTVRYLEIPNANFPLVDFSM